MLPRFAAATTARSLVRRRNPAFWRCVPPLQPAPQHQPRAPAPGAISFSSFGSTSPVSPSNSNHGGSSSSGSSNNERASLSSPPSAAPLSDGDRPGEEQPPPPPPPVSNRARFRRAAPHPSILRYVQSIGVGVPERVVNASKIRRSLRDVERAQQQHRGNGSSYLPPPPFGPGARPVKVVGSVGIVQQQPVDDDDDDDDDENPDDSKMRTTTTTTTRSTLGAPQKTIPLRHHRFPRNQAQTPEVALAGRSNVGKSTLLNALLYGNRSEETVRRTKQFGRVPANLKLPRGKKAAASHRPGETREIGFYMLQHLTVLEDEVENRLLTLVDLPGYGFAYAKEEHRREFQNLVADYLLNRGRPPLQRVLLLLDARHGLKRVDVEFLEMLQLEVERRRARALREERPKRSAHPRERAARLPQMPPVQLVLTKCDLVSQTDLARRVARVRQDLSDALRREPAPLPILLVSARAGVGYNNVDGRTNRSRGGVLELQRELAGLVRPRRSPRKHKGRDEAAAAAEKAKAEKQQNAPRNKLGRTAPSEKRKMENKKQSAAN